MPTSKTPNTRYLHRFKGYYLEDCLCCYCRFNRGSKLGCSLDTCMCLDEKLDAIVHGWIERKRGSMVWDR